MRPLIATPAFGGLFHESYVGSVLQLQALVERRGGSLSFYFRRDSHIDRARGDCVAYFLSTEATHLFFIDADIGFAPDAFVRLLAAGKDIAGGVYPIKRDDGGFPIDLDAIGPADDKGLAECNELPGGFLCIKRAVFEKVDPATAFDSFRVDGRLITEDYAFCARARAAGFTLYADTRSSLSHTGDKTFTDDFAKAITLAAMRKLGEAA